MSKILVATLLVGLAAGCAGKQQAEPSVPPAIGNSGGPSDPRRAPVGAEPQHTLAVSPSDCDPGTICGTVFDKQTKEAIVGATVVATSPALQGTVAEITDQQGRYVLRELPPGEYRISLYYADIVVEQAGVPVDARVDGVIDTAAMGGEVIEIRD